MEWVHSHIAKPPISLQTVKPQIPATLSNVIAKLMAKNAEERYQSGWGLKADLEECLHQLQTENTIRTFNLGQPDRFGPISFTPTVVWTRGSNSDLIGSIRSHC